jgi:hypothetical protein
MTHPKDPKLLILVCRNRRLGFAYCHAIAFGSAKVVQKTTSEEKLPSEKEKRKRERKEKEKRKRDVLKQIKKVDRFFHPALSKD